MTWATKPCLSQIIYTHESLPTEGTVRVNGQGPRLAAALSEIV
jgi:hypothetical protein